MREGARRIASRGELAVLALPAWRAPRKVLVPEVVVGEPGRGPVGAGPVAVVLDAPGAVASYGMLRVPAPGSLVDLYC